MPGKNVRIFDDVSELSLRAAESATKTINEVVASRGSCAVALSGGNTPRTVYSLLASTFRDQIPWTLVEVFWADERYVPANAPESNYRMARETMLDLVPCPARNVHPMPTSFASAEDAAQDYERTLRGYFGDGPPCFDLIFLGLGGDSHTASLFPGSPALVERSRLVVATHAPVQPFVRLTLTLPVLSRAASIFMLATGTSKASAVHHVLSGTADPNLHPAAGVRPTDGTMVWWVDREANGPAPGG